MHLHSDYNELAAESLFRKTVLGRSRNRNGKIFAILLRRLTYAEGVPKAGEVAWSTQIVS